MMQPNRAAHGRAIAADGASDGRTAPPPDRGRSLAQRGQMLVVFVMSIFVIIGMVGLVIDVSWYWTNTLRVQRAADAAALAGAVNLPALPAAAVSDAVAQAGKNGYPSLPLGCKADNTTPSTVSGMCAHQDSSNRNQLDVTISAPVGTFFMRVFGIQTLTATRSSKALYTLPVPMGSPENYYGVFGNVRNATMTTTTMVPQTTTNTVTGGNQGAGLLVPTTSPANVPVSTQWTTTSGTLVAAVTTNDTTYAQTSTNGAFQQWGTFGLLSGATPPIPAPIGSGTRRPRSRSPASRCS
jgi:Flp pilus assembly protein TadG